MFIAVAMFKEHKYVRKYTKPYKTYQYGRFYNEMYQRKFHLPSSWD